MRPRDVHAPRFPFRRHGVRRLIAAGLVMVCLAPGLAAAQEVPGTPEETLAALWQSYRDRYITAKGEVIDPSREGRVSSEAQSYALVRAVWMRDHATFARVLAWTDAHLRRPDGLYSWWWDPARNVALDRNTATDGDIEIAYALAMASVVFERPAYATAARALVRAIRAGATLPVGDGWFPSAGNWAGPERIVNLSYFYPYATPWFAWLDPGAGWEQLNARGYALIARSLDAGPWALPADFHVLRETGDLEPLPPGHALSALFSYDSMRIPWRVEMACRLLGEAQACRLSERLVSRLRALQERDGRIVTRYSPEGGARNAEESTSFYAAFLPAFQRVAPEIARTWRASHLGAGAIGGVMRDTHRYYDANWVWFGLAAADGVLESRTPPVPGQP